jgi:hypothetical protein
MTTRNPINPFAIMKALPFDITNLIDEFIGEEDKKELFKKTILDSVEFDEKLDKKYIYQEDYEWEKEIRDKLIYGGFVPNKCSVNFYDGEDERRVSYLECYGNGQSHKYDFTLLVFSDNEIKEIMYDWSNDANNLCYVETKTLKDYLRCCGINLSIEQIDSMKDYNNEIGLSILNDLVHNHLIDNTIDFAEFMMEKGNRGETLDILWGDCFTMSDMDDGGVFVLMN